LLKSFDGFRCHLVGTLVGFNDTLCYMGVADPSGEGEMWGRTPPPRQNTHWEIATKPSVLCCCHQPNTNEESDSTFYQITLACVINNRKG